MGSAYCFSLLWVLGLLLAGSCTNQQKNPSGNVTEQDFAPEMVAFVPYKSNPVFRASATNTWDKQIRERGYILYEDSVYKMWYTGYNGDDTVIKYLGYATSRDGISWQRYANNPIFLEKWTEDMCVVKHEGRYYMFAEGRDDVAHCLVSPDGINWKEEGDLTIHTKTGKAIPGPYGTPAVWLENGTWHLFYERNDEGIWLARSTDHMNWTNVRDEPVIEKGPDKYDQGAVAANQVVKHKGRYYMYYHAASEPMMMATAWSTNVAMSDDLVHWIKYYKNPIVEGDHSSPITVRDKAGYRLYTMHPQVDLYLSKRTAGN